MSFLIHRHQVRCLALATLARIAGMRCAGAAAGAGAAAHLLLLALLLLLIALQLFNEFLCLPHRHLYAFHLRQLFRFGPFTVSDPKCRTALDEAHGSCYQSVSVSSVRLQSSCYQSIGIGIKRSISKQSCYQSIRYQAVWLQSFCYQSIWSVSERLKKNVIQAILIQIATAMIQKMR